MKTTILRIVCLLALLIQSIEILAGTMTTMLTPQLEKHLQILAKAAGRTPEQMLKLVTELSNTIPTR